LITETDVLQCFVDNSRKKTWCFTKSNSSAHRREHRDFVVSSVERSQRSLED